MLVLSGFRDGFFEATINLLETLEVWLLRPVSFDMEDADIALDKRDPLSPLRETGVAFECTVDAELRLVSFLFGRSLRLRIRLRRFVESRDLFCLS